MIMGNRDGEFVARVATAHVLQRVGGEAVVAGQCRRVAIVLAIVLQMRAGMRHHAELHAQQRERQQVNEPAAGSTGQKGLRAEVSAPVGVISSGGTRG